MLCYLVLGVPLAFYFHYKKKKSWLRSLGEGFGWVFVGSILITSVFYALGWSVSLFYPSFSSGIPAATVPSPTIEISRSVMKKPTSTYYIIPSSTPECTIWSAVTLRDVGRTMCVYGTVRNQYHTDALYITFSSDPTDFYMLSYGNWDYPDLVGNCALAIKTIKQLGSAPVMVIDNVDLKHCP